MITKEYVDKIFKYDKKTGNLIWKKPPPKKAKQKNVIAGLVTNKGYRIITINGKKYSSSKIVWLIHNGYIPTRNIIHINGNSLDDRIDNLKLKIKSDIDISYENIRNIFDYKNGNLYWINPLSSKIKKGTQAGYKSQDGYIRIEFQNTQYMAHRLIWMWHNGYFPENDIDHINMIKHDNRIENLREVSRSCNIRNSGNRKCNTSGVKGVHWVNRFKKWQSRIGIDKLRFSLGYYNDFNNAVLARLTAEICLNKQECKAYSPAYKYAIKHNLIRRKKWE